MHNANQIERTLSRISEGTIQVTKNTSHSILDETVSSFSSSDDDGDHGAIDGMIGNANSSAPNDNYNVYITDSNKYIAYILEMNNRVRKIKSKYVCETKQLKDQLRKPELCIIKIQDCRKDAILTSKGTRIKLGRYDEIRHYNILLPCDDRQLYSDLVEIYKREIKLVTDWRVSRSVSIGIIGNDLATSRIIKQTLDNDATIYTYKDLDITFKLFEPIMEHWNFNVKKTKENHIKLWQQMKLPIHEYYIVCDDSFHNQRDTGKQGNHTRTEKTKSIVGYPCIQYIERLNNILSFIDTIKFDLLLNKKDTKLLNKGKFLVFGNYRWNTAAKVVHQSLQYFQNANLNVLAVISEIIYFKHFFNKVLLYVE